MAKNPLIRSFPRKLSKPLPNKSAGILEDFVIRKNINTKAGTVTKVPVNPNDIINKAYGDANYSAGSGDVTAASNLTDETIVQGDGGTKGVKTSTATVAQIASNVAHVADVTGDPHNIEADTLTFTNKTLDSFTNHVEADEVHAQLRNESGGEMSVGDAVHISGYSVGLDRALVSLADSSVGGTMPAVALLTDATLANNATGHFIQTGSIHDMNTDSWNVGDDIYISETGTTGNTLTNTKPTGTALIQKVGVVLRKHASLGVVEVFGAGRTNDLPNLPSNNIWLGNGSGVPAETNFDTEVSANTDVTDNTSKAHTQNTDTALGSGAVAADHGTAATDQIINVAYGTGSPPTANTTTEGALFIKYTA